MAPRLRNGHGAGFREGPRINILGVTLSTLATLLALGGCAPAGRSVRCTTLEAR